MQKVLLVLSVYLLTTSITETVAQRNEQFTGGPARPKAPAPIPAPVPVATGGSIGRCANVYCGPGMRCRDDPWTNSAHCEKILGPNPVGDCNCYPLEYFGNIHNNQLEFSGNRCWMSVTCYRTKSRFYVYLGFRSNRYEVARTVNMPNWVKKTVFCRNGQWLVDNKPFDEFDC